LQMSYAFKRIKWSRLARSNESRNFQALISEVLVLGHPLIRKHPNIIRLEGICWDFPPGDDRVWPVLVFEKAQNGDLARFLNSDPGKHINFENRLKLCANVAAALKFMHSCRELFTPLLMQCENAHSYVGIIHGDLKPRNILVFKDSDGYVAKVADFGYSTVVANDGWIDMPYSKYWSAPEQHHRGFRLTDAMKMDAYSFGMLCLWLMFYNTIEYPDRNFLNDLESEDKLPPLALAHQLIMTTTGLDDKWQSNLRQVFNLTLVHDQGRRCSDFVHLLRLLAPDR
jgi:serine/threonine protein kinase